MKKLKLCAFKRSFTTGKSPKWHMCEACRELKGHDSWSITGQNVQSSQAVSLQLKLATRSTRKIESLECLVWMKIDFSYSSHTLL